MWNLKIIDMFKFQGLDIVGLNSSLGKKMFSGAPNEQHSLN